MQLQAALALLIGVPTECTFTPVGCFDDCTSGLAISGFACDALLLDGGTD